MSRLTIGIVDYGVGNLASVSRGLSSMGYRCRVSSDKDVLGNTDLILLPGVGAFPAAMQALHENAMVDFLQMQFRQGKPMVGICLGMQLLADTSIEKQHTAGLGLIPGEVLPLHEPEWHIGWNTIEVLDQGSILKPSDGQAVYFNHSYILHTPKEYQIAVSRHTPTSPAFTVAVRKDNLVGLQFHPEKSQTIGRKLLSHVIEELCDA